MDKRDDYRKGSRRYQVKPVYGKKGFLFQENAVNRIKGTRLMPDSMRYITKSFIFFLFLLLDFPVNHPHGIF